MIDITSNYSLDSGQRDSYYDHAALILRSGANPPTGQTVVMLQYYSHDSVLGFFDVDSYSANAYATGLIPYYNSTKFGTTFSLRDSIDFRPTRTIGTTANVQAFTLNGLSLPQPDHSFQLSFQFYLPRIDKLQVTKDKVVRIKQGTPSQYPAPPSDSDDAMTLYVLTIPAYTANVKDIQVQYIENKRYTMRDVGALDKRIQQLEYYSSLSQLESQAVNEKILYNDNVTAKDQYGIIADDFGSFSIADTQSTSLRCFLEQGSMGPYKVQTPLALNFSTSSGGGYNLSDKVYSLSFTETAALVQNTATTYISVQPFLFAQFKGVCKLSPETDSYYSANIPPTIIAPPASPATETPPLPPPPAAATLPLANNATPVKTVVGSAVSLTPPSGILSYYSVAGSFGIPYPSVYVPNNFTGYGVFNNVYNWLGTPINSVTAQSQTTPPSNLGTPLQLASGGQLTQGTAFNINAIRNLYNGGLNIL